MKTQVTPPKSESKPSIVWKDIKPKKPFFLASSIQPADSATVAFRIVLHESRRKGELVVHHQNTGDKSFYYGHYFPDALTDPKEGALAMADYVATCAKYNLNPCGSIAL